MEVLDPSVSSDFWERVFEAQSRHPSTKKTDFPAKHEFVAWEYIHHNDGSCLSRRGAETLPSGDVRIKQEATFPKGLSTTRFHQGFQRRKQSDIKQDESRLQRQEHKRRQSLIHLEKRRQRLVSLDSRNGFSLSMDSTHGRSTTPFHVQPRTREIGSLSEVAERTEYLLLRDSKYKFHAPAWSGKNHDKRQDLLQREGLNKPKQSTLLGIGGSDLASAGANDMFSKSIYDPANACAVEGLVDTCIPGRFTPRKVAAARETVGIASTAAAPVAATVESDGNGLGLSGGESYVRGNVRASSPAALGTVFRVIPYGLGNSRILARRAGASVAGIAPSKRLCASRSTPRFLSQEPNIAKAKARRTPPLNPRPVQSSSLGASVSARSTSRGGKGSGSGFAERLIAVTGAANLASERDARDGGSCDGFTHVGISGENRESAHPQSECKSRIRAAGERERDKAHPSLVRSQSLGSFRNRGASTSQLRKADQLALDMAAVRSL